MIDDIKKSREYGEAINQEVKELRLRIKLLLEVGSENRYVNLSG